MILGPVLFPAATLVPEAARFKFELIIAALALNALAALFATHPPLIERIRALDPGFDPATTRCGTATTRP
ncbi:MAG: hypothetical protein EA405_13805 [Rhodospirillales bacterium]|nr:MAG: hypothetical protein EA405_13805 [Rhodospirillales bacterium]